MKNNKIITFVACLIVSIGLWFFVVKVVNPDSDPLIFVIFIVCPFLYRFDSIRF